MLYGRLSCASEPLVSSVELKKRSMNYVFSERKVRMIETSTFRNLLAAVLLTFIGAVLPAFGAAGSSPAASVLISGIEPGVNDSAQFLTWDGGVPLRKLCSRLQNDNLRIKVVVVTVKSLDAVKGDLEAKWKAAYGDDRSVLLIVDADKNWDISIGKGIESRFTVDALNKIGNGMAPDLNAGKYETALVGAVNAIATTMNLPATDPRVNGAGSGVQSGSTLEPVRLLDNQPSTERFQIPMSVLYVSLGVIIVIAALSLISASTFTVRTMEGAVIERFSKFNRTEGPGIHLKIPFIESVYTVDLQVQQAVINVETKTSDNVFVRIPVSVQYQVLQDKVFDAFYKLSKPIEQIDSYVFNAILGHVPTMTLDDTFAKQATISAAVKTELDADMAGFGYSILKTLVTDISPDNKVKEAMNDINAAQREQEAAKARGEAEKILKVKAAEAESESKALQGQGVAKQRKAIIDGLKESIDDFTKAVPGSDPGDVMKTVLLTQYFDTLREIGSTGKSTTILLPNSPGSVGDFMTQLVATAHVAQPQK